MVAIVEKNLKFGTFPISLFQIVFKSSRGKTSLYVQHVMWSIHESDGSWSDCNCLETTKKGKGSHQKVCFFSDILSWYYFNIHWSSFTENFLKSSKQNAGFLIGHSEINSSVFSFK